MIVPAPWWSAAAPAATQYLLDEFDGTGSMDTRAPTVGFDTGNWVNGFSGVIYFAERVGGLVKPKSPDTEGRIFYGAVGVPAATTVNAPIKVLFTFNTGLQADAAVGFPKLYMAISTEWHFVEVDLTCYNGTDFSLSLSHDGVSQDTGAPAPAWETTYSGELTITDGNQTLTFMGQTLLSANVWDEPLRTISLIVRKGGGIGRIEITDYAP